MRLAKQKRHQRLPLRAATAQQFSWVVYKVAIEDVQHTPFFKKDFLGKLEGLIYQTEDPTMQTDLSEIVRTDKPETIEDRQAGRKEIIGGAKKLLTL